MLRFILQRILITIPLLFSVGVLAFLLVDLIPGSPAVVMLQDAATPENVAILEEQMGLNDPLPERFIRWTSGAIVGDFGNSVLIERPVTQMLLERLQPTMSIAVGGLLLGIILGLFLGVFAGLYPGSILDRIITILTSALIGVPGFLLGIILILYFALNRGWFPVIGYSPIQDGFSAWLNTITLPASALAIPTSALVARQMRSSMSNVLQSKYIQAARAGGIPRWRIVSRYALRNAMIPVVTVIGFRIAVILGSTFVIELVFNISGIGRLLVKSVLDQDVPVIQGGMVLVAFIVAISSLIIDLSYAWLNPRVRLE